MLLKWACLVILSMWRLIAVSIIWAFSFGLIKGKLTGLDSGMVASIRLILCFLCFAPFLLKVKPAQVRWRLMVLGAVQFGMMYLAYIKSYQYLPGYLVAVFTIFTPFYVILLNSIFGGNQRMKQLRLSGLAALLSVLGAGVIVYKAPKESDFLIGFLILQGANICFAIGQWHYQRWAKGSDAGNMSWMYLGAACFASVISFPQLNWGSVSISNEQILVLLYLGVIASGLCFYLWNSGSKQVNTSTLAVMNNGYIPVAVVASIVLFSEPVDLYRLIIGGGLIALSAWVAQKYAT